MTWSAFFNALKSGVSQRAATVTGRRGGSSAVNRPNSTTTRSTSTQTQIPKNKLSNQGEFWDFMVLDEFGEPQLVSSPW